MVPPIGLKRGPDGELTVYLVAGVRSFVARMQVTEASG